MKIYDNELDIQELVEDNSATNVCIFINKSQADANQMLQQCQGEACSCDFIKKVIAKTESSDIVPFSSILVSDLWNSNDDVFCAEEILKARNTPIYKPINWMHRGSEETKNETIGVMVNSRIVQGPLSSLRYFTDSDIDNFSKADIKETVSGQLHIRQDGVIWSQYFPTYAKKIAKGIEDGNLYVSMECFFEDFDYILRDDDDSEEYIIIARDNLTSKFSKALKSYGGRGLVMYKGKEYNVGRLLRGIVFSGQGIVKDPANIKDGNILSIIINDEDAFSNKVEAQSPDLPNMPSIDPTETTDPTQNEPKSSPKDSRQLPTTYVAPSDFLFNTSEEATFVAENILGCTGYHVYLENRHSEQPFLFADLIGDPDDLEKQLMRPKFLPCGDHKEFLLLTDREGSPGDQGGGGQTTGCPQDTDVCLTLSGNNLNYSTLSNIKQFQIQHDKCVSEASGGDAEANGLNTTVNDTHILSVGPEGTFIPEGEGTLIVLSGKVIRDCLSSPQFYDEDGNLLVVAFASGATAPTGGEGDEDLSVNTSTSTSIMSAGAWAKLKKKIQVRIQEFADNQQNGYNNNENPEGNTMNDKNNVNYQEMYERATKELAAIKSMETSKEITKLNGINKRLESDLFVASEAIDKAADVLGTIPELQSELLDLREFVSQADTVISELEATSLGSHRLSELMELVGDTYGEDDIENLSGMSEDTYAHLYDSMNKVVSKIEEAAAQIEEKSVETDINELENARILNAIKAVDVHKPVKGGNMLVKAARQDKMSAARSLISNALRR